MYRAISIMSRAQKKGSTRRRNDNEEEKRRGIKDLKSQKKSKVQEPDATMHSSTL